MEVETEDDIAVFTYTKEEFLILGKILRYAFELRTLNNPDADEDEIAALMASIIEAFEEGHMIVIDEEVE